MNIVVEKISKKDKEKLERLIQLYLHDLSLYFPISFNSDVCKYDYNLDKYFEDNYAYFIKSSDNILGFILVDDNKNGNYEISEIFVLNNYKQKKVGEQAAIKIFNKHKGNWIIKAVPSSIIAESFWKKVISKYTNNHYELKYTGKYNRHEFYFCNYKDVE